MMKASLMRWLVLALLPACGWAQNDRDHVEIFYGFVVSDIHIPSQTIPGTQVTLSSASPQSNPYGVAFRLTRLSYGQLWIEFPWTSVSPTQSTSIPPYSVQRTTQAMVPGLRYAIPLDHHSWPAKKFPLYSGLSAYVSAGAGLGFFDYPVVVSAPQPQVFLNSTTHGVFDVAGGIELHLFHTEGLRFDVRDLVTGQGLSGVAGRNHLVPSLEFVIHL
jgi:hypothetical protein